MAQLAVQQQGPEEAAAAMRDVSDGSSDPGHVALCNYMKGELAQLPPLSLISQDVALNTTFLIPQDFVADYGLDPEVAAQRLSAFQKHVEPHVHPNDVAGAKIERYLTSGDLLRHPLPSMDRNTERTARVMLAYKPEDVQARFGLTAEQAAQRLKVVQGHVGTGLVS